MFSRVARFYLDHEHDFVLQMMSRRLHRIRVGIVDVQQSLYDSMSSIHY